MLDNDISKDLQQQVEQALTSNSALNICGGNSKNFYGHEASGQTLSVNGHSGIINYEPTELVITVRAGTSLNEIEQALAKENQMFAFEPPTFGDTATIGGTIACNLSGPRRAFAGSARDFVLGTRIINGRAEQLHFGGEVMKNVAGYDISRLMCGAMGTMGVLLEVSIKVLPRPEVELTLVHEMNAADSLEKVHQLARRALPVSATTFDDHKLHIRLSGTDAAVQDAAKQIGGDELSTAETYWQQLKEQQLDYFNQPMNIWRLSLASNSPLLNLSGKFLYEWNGAQRWLVSDEKESVIRQAVSQHGGHALCFKQTSRPQNVFHPLDKGIFKLHQQLKKEFDPESIFNPGRMYAEL